MLNKLDKIDYEWDPDMDPEGIGAWINIGNVVIHIFEDTKDVVTVEALPKGKCGEENILYRFSVVTVEEKD